MTTVSLSTPADRRIALAAKRSVDLTLALLGLALTAPLLAVVAVAIRLDSPGPAIFRQERVGLGGSRFTIFKFRSMRRDADPAVHRAFLQATSRGETPGVYKAAQVDAVTRVGRFIRRTSIDELPQLWNVVRGEMSLVGPRPDVPYHLDEYEPRHHRRFDVLPGITGLWQVSGRSELSPRQMLDLDVRYVDTWSLRRDLVLLVQTIPQVLHLERAG